MVEDIENTTEIADLEPFTPSWYAGLEPDEQQFVDRILVELAAMYPNLDIRVRDRAFWILMEVR